MARLICAAPARRFRLEGKGRLAEGWDADLVLVEAAAWTATPADLHQRHPISPYLGRRFGWRVVRTVVRGRTVYARGFACSDAWGRLVRPGRRTGEG